MKPSLTSEATGPAGKNGKHPPSERLRDDDGESFGRSRQACAFERKMRLRKKARLFRERSRPMLIVLPATTPSQIYEPVSDEARELGIRSYKVEMAERESVIGRQVRCFGGKISISLPFVSILHSTTTGEAR